MRRNKSHDIGGLLKTFTENEQMFTSVSSMHGSAIVFTLMRGMVMLGHIVGLGDSVRREDIARYDYRQCVHVDFDGISIRTEFIGT